MADRSDAAAPPRAVVVAASVLAVALIVVVAVIGLTSSGSPAPRPVQPLAVPAVSAPAAGSASCRRLVGSLPSAVKSNGSDLQRRRLASPAPAGAVAWGVRDPIVLRCGVGRPASLKATSELRQINGVSWLPVASGGSQTWYVVDRRVYVALSLSGDVGTGPLQDVSTRVGRVLPPR